MSTPCVHAEKEKKSEPIRKMCNGSICVLMPICAQKNVFHSFGYTTCDLPSRESTRALWFVTLFEFGSCKVGLCKDHEIFYTDAIRTPVSTWADMDDLKSPCHTC